MKKLLLTLLSLISFSSFGLLPHAVSVAQTSATDSVCEGIGTFNNETKQCEEPTDSPSVEDVISTVVTILSYIIGAASVIVIIVGGFKYITSGGDSNKVGSAKNTIIYALIGLAVAVLAQVIIRFVIDKTTNPPPPPVNCTIKPDATC